MADTSPIDALAEILSAVAEERSQRVELSQWVRDHHDEFGGQATMRALPALWAAALAETHADDFTRAGPPFFLRAHDLREWAATLRQEDVAYAEGATVQRFRWHQFGEEEMPALARVTITATAIATRLGISSIRGQWDRWVFEDFLFLLEDGTRCVLTNKMEHSPRDHEDFVLEIEGGGTEAAHASLAFLGTRPEDVVWLD